MNRSIVVITLLSAALLVSNAYWLYRLLDAGVSLTYRDQTLQEHHEALAQVIAVVPVAVSLNSSRHDVIEAARSTAASPGEPFEKGGFIWVGSLGLRFTSTGRLAEVAPAWEPF
jgi:hypothetical protein